MFCRDSSLSQDCDVSPAASQILGKSSSPEGPVASPVMGKSSSPGGVPVAGASLRSSRVVSSRAVKSKYIEYNDSRRICRQCEEYTECSASWQPRVQTVQGDHIAGLDLHRNSYISESVPLSVSLCHYQ